MAKNCALGFSAGFGIGIGLALLFAPQSGDDTKKLLARKTRKAKEYVASQASTLREQAADLLEQGKQEMSRHREGFEQALDAGKKIYKESLG